MAEKVCTYLGSAFHSGERICEADKCRTCIDGEWVEEEGV